VREDLAHKIDETNMRLDRLYEVIVRREEQEQLASRVARLEQ
jgi:HAMP domain-containing protein